MKNNDDKHLIAFIRSSFARFPLPGGRFLAYSLTAALIVISSLAGCARDNLIGIDPDSPDSLQWLAANDYYRFMNRKTMQYNTELKSPLPCLYGDSAIPYVLRLDISNESRLSDVEIRAIWIGEQELCIAFPWQPRRYEIIEGERCLQPSFPLKIWKGRIVLLMSPLEQKALVSSAASYSASIFEFPYLKEGGLLIAAHNRSQHLSLQFGQCIEEPFPVYSLSFFPAFKPRAINQKAYRYEREMAPEYWACLSPMFKENSLAFLKASLSEIPDDADSFHDGERKDSLKESFDSPRQPTPQ